MMQLVFVIAHCIAVPVLKAPDLWPKAIPKHPNFEQQLQVPRKRSMGHCQFAQEKVCWTIGDSHDNPLAQTNFTRDVEQSAMTTPGALMIFSAQCLHLFQVGASISPITTECEKVTEITVCLFPARACGDMANSQNEKWSISNLINGAKVLVLYL